MNKNTFLKLTDINTSDKTIAADIINLPYPKLQQTMNGIHKGDLFLLEARPDMGTTTFCINLAVHFAKQKKKIAYISLDRSKFDIAKRFETCLANFSEVVAKRPSRKKKKEELEIYINSYRNWDDVELIGAIREMVLKHKIDIFILDYIQLLAPMGGEYNNTKDDIISHLQSIKHKIRNSPTSIIVVSKLIDFLSSKEQYTPQVDECYVDWSTDNVVVLDRLEKYLISEDLGNLTANMLNLHIYKNKHGKSAENLQKIEFEVDFEKQLIKEL